MTDAARRVAVSRRTSNPWWLAAAVLIAAPGLALAALAGERPGTPVLALAAASVLASALVGLGLSVLGASRSPLIHAAFALVAVAVAALGLVTFARLEPQPMPDGDYPGSALIMSAGVGLGLLTCLAAMGRQRRPGHRMPRWLPAVSAVPSLAFVCGTDTFAPFQGWSNTSAPALLMAAVVRGLPLLHLALVVTLTITPRHSRFPHVTAWMASTVAMGLWGFFVGGFLLVSTFGEGSVSTGADRAVFAAMTAGGLACWAALIVAFLPAKEELGTAG